MATRKVAEAPNANATPGTAAKGRKGKSSTAEAPRAGARKRTAAASRTKATLAGPGSAPVRTPVPALAELGPMVLRGEPIADITAAQQFTEQDIKLWVEYERFMTTLLEGLGLEHEEQKVVDFIEEWGTHHRTDHIVWVPGSRRKVLVSDKWQGSKGTTEEKLPNEAIKLRKTVRNRRDIVHAVIVLDGGGWNPKYVRDLQENEFPDLGLDKHVTLYASTEEFLAAGIPQLGVKPMPRKLRTSQIGLLQDYMEARRVQLAVESEAKKHPGQQQLPM